VNYAVILAGGVGERFWPASTPARPKQLLPLISDRTMLRETVDRLGGLVPPENSFVVTHKSLVRACEAECPEIPSANVIGEPEGKNTAPAIGLMSGLLSARDPAAVLVALPADHAIGDIDAFRATVKDALRLAAEKPAILVFGVVPSRPEAAYGYIERGRRIEGAVEAYEVTGFLEKPDLAMARTLWNDGRHLWNSGLFCGQATVFLAEYARHLPLMRRSIDAAVRSWEEDRVSALDRYYAAVEATSIDVGVMQGTDRAFVLPAANWGWDDVGSWDALARWVDSTGDGNIEVGRTSLAQCRDVIAYAQAGRIAALGLDGCVIVRTEEETLVVARDALEGLRDFVRRMNDARPDGRS
jgi:mannose-1-phosphate guanylyltransferase